MIFKIATYNVNLSQFSPDLIQNVLLMKEDGANIFCFQEILRDGKRSFIIKDMVEKLGKTWKAEYFLGKEPGYFGHGVAIVWDTKIFKKEGVVNIPLPKLTTLGIHEIMGERIAGYYGKPVQRRAISALFSIGKKNIRVTSVHLDLQGGPKHRKKQILYMLDVLKKEPKVEYEIICGDFNTSDLANTGMEAKSIEKIFKQLSFFDATKEISWSADIYHATLGFPQKIIKLLHFHLRKKVDYIWLKGLEVIEAKRKDVYGSDHFPLVAKVKLKD